MNWNRLGSYLVTLCIVSLVATTSDVHANLIAAPKKKKQSFVLAPKTEQTKSFINFSKFNGKDASKFESVKFKGQPLKSKGKKKPAAEFNFGAPVGSAADGYTVSVEMVSLSLISANPVSLDPFLDKADRGNDLMGDIILSLFAPTLKVKSPAELDPNIAEKKRTGGKLKGKLDIKLDKKFKVSTKKNGVKKSKELDKKKFKAKDVNFAFNSPITITEPSFCLENGDFASICLAPIASAVPLPRTLALMVLGLTVLFLGHIVRRRYQKGSAPSSPAWISA